jgi:hypothetical protein
VVAYDYSDYDISLDIIELYASGIMIGEYDAANISYGNTTWTEFSVNETNIRARWENWILTGKTGILFQTEAEFFTFQPWIDFRWDNIEGGLIITNQTIIAEYNTDYNWSRFNGKTGYVLFITDPLRQGNITRAVMEDGNVTLTICENVAWASEPDLNSFVNWYLGLVTGAESWGLPESFSILVRIFTMMGIFSGIFLMSEVRRILIG